LLAPILAMRPEWTGAEFDGWELIPFTFHGEHVGTAVLSGTEIHFALMPGTQIKGSIRGTVREFTQPLLDRFGFLTTRVGHDRPAQKRFVQRIGFNPTWENDIMQFYMLGETPFQRTRRC
jgi:hypothetical protein